MRNEKILGKKCDVYEANDDSGQSTTWVYKGLDLKYISMGGIMDVSLIPTKFEENAKIPGDKFVVPPGVKMIPFKDFVKMRMKK